MKTLNVAFREVKSGRFKGDVECVFLDSDTFETNYLLRCYSRVGQHSIGCVSYFYNDTKPAKDYDSLLKEIQSIYNDYDVVIHNRLPNQSYILSEARRLILSDFSI